MKAVRLLAAACLAATLAACGAEPITGVAPDAARRGAIPKVEGTVLNGDPIYPAECTEAPLDPATDPAGSTPTTCSGEGKGQYGTGG